MLCANENCSKLYNDIAFIVAVDNLEKVWLAHGLWVEGHNLEGAQATIDGRKYLLENPHLLNPINWQTISVVVAIASLAVAIISLLVACTILRRIS